MLPPAKDHIQLQDLFTLRLTAHVVHLHHESAHTGFKPLKNDHLELKSP